MIDLEYHISPDSQISISKNIYYKNPREKEFPAPVLLAIVWHHLLQIPLSFPYVYEDGGAALILK